MKITLQLEMQICRSIDLHNMDNLFYKWLKIWKIIQITIELKIIV